MLRRRLAKHGYEMIVAEDGQKGILHLRHLLTTAWNCADAA